MALSLREVMFCDWSMSVVSLTRDCVICFCSLLSDIVGANRHAVLREEESVAVAVVYSVS